MTIPPRPDPGTSQPTSIARVIDRLVYQYDGLLPREQVAAIVADSHRRLAERARVTAYLPALTERLARERLDAAMQAAGLVAKRVPEVLFVCVHNAGRSQMAAAR